MIIRSYKASSTYDIFHQQITVLKQTFINNSYPNFTIDSYPDISQQLNSYPNFTIAGYPDLSQQLNSYPNFAIDSYRDISQQLLDQLNSIHDPQHTKSFVLIKTITARPPWSRSNIPHLHPRSIAHPQTLYISNNKQTHLHTQHSTFLLVMHQPSIKNIFLFRCSRLFLPVRHPYKNQFCLILFITTAALTWAPSAVRCPLFGCTAPCAHSACPDDDLRWSQNFGFS